MGLLFLYVTLALVFSFLCSVAEAVLLSVTPAYIARLEEEDNPVGALLRHHKENVDRPLTAILSLNTVAHTIGAAGAGAQAAAVFGSRWVGLASVVLTLLILVLSEIIPKTLGAVHWRALAPLTARSLKWLVLLLFPFVKLGEGLARLISPRETPLPFDREELGAMADLGARSGGLQHRESQIVKNLLRLETLRLFDVMTPRTVLASLPARSSVLEALERNPRLPFSRLPIYGRDLDDITGFVLKADLLLARAEGRKDIPLQDLSREITVAPGQLSLRDAFDLLLQQRQQILLVIDEFGGTAGVATMEDIVETLLGMEIVDEADRTADMQELARRQWRVRARRLGILQGEDVEE